MAAQTEYDRGADTITVGDTLNWLLVQEAGRISSDIYRRTIDSSVWLKLVKQDRWPDEMGDTISVLTYERSMPAASQTQTWSDVITGVGNTKWAIPDATTISVAQSLRSFNLQHTALESDPISVNMVRPSFRFREQLRNVYENLVENVAFLWKERYRTEYARLAEHKMIAMEDITAAGQILEDSAAFPVANNALDLVEANIGRLSHGILDEVYLNLIRDGAGNAAMARANGRPVFTLVTSAEMSDRLVKQARIAGTDPSIDDSVREDYRHADPNSLLAPLGVDKSYRGFFHVVDPFPPRWNYTDSAWVRVEPYTEDTGWAEEADVDGRTLTRRILNPAYLTAAYEDSFVFIPEVYTSLVPAPLTSGGGNTSFDPVNYRGDFKFLNIRDRVSNPDGNWGFFRGICASGSKPVRPEWGYVIRHKRVTASLSKFIGTDEAAISLA